MILSFYSAIGPTWGDHDNCLVWAKVLREIKGIRTNPSPCILKSIERRKVDLTVGLTVAAIA